MTLVASARPDCNSNSIERAAHAGISLDSARMANRNFDEPCSMATVAYTARASLDNPPSRAEPPGGDPSAA